MEQSLLSLELFYITFEKYENSGYGASCKDLFLPILHIPVCLRYFSIIFETCISTAKN